METSFRGLPEHPELAVQDMMARARKEREQKQATS